MASSSASSAPDQSPPPTPGDGGVSAIPTAMTGRSIAPDLARGLMLLLIAVANAPVFLYGRPLGSFGFHPLPESTADKIAQTIAIIGIDGRVYPMFAFLFGYGIVQLYRKQTAAGVTKQQARRLLRRRHLWMIAFGFVHAALLWYGDIIGAYGLAGLILVAIFLDLPDRAVLTAAAGLVAVLGALAAMTLYQGFAEGLVSSPGRPGESWPLNANAEPDILAAAWARIAAWTVFGLPTAILGLIIPASILLSFVAARHRILEEPGQHLRLLSWVAGIGLSLGWGSGLVVALQSLDALGVDRGLDYTFVGLNQIAGLCGGVGYVALFGLLAAWLERRNQGAKPGGRRGAAWAIQAVGKRSLSCYLFQSVIFAPLLAAWALGWGARMSSWSVALLAVGIWLTSVVLAAILELRGQRGPAEWLLRRLVYPRTSQ